MHHLNIRITPQDENNLLLLKNAWNVDKSEATRKALALAAACIAQEQSLSKEELIKNSQFIGSNSSPEVTSKNYKQKLKQVLKKKYDR